MLAAKDPVSLDKKIGIEQKQDLADILVDEEQELPIDAILRSDMSVQVLELLTTLSPREAEIIKKRYGLGQSGEDSTLEQVGKLFDVTRERIRQIEANAIRKLRAATSRSDLKKRIRLIS